MSVIQFSGKYVYKPGAVKGIDLKFQNNTGREINDLLLYVFPTSILVDTPDITMATITSENRKIIDVNNKDEDGDADDDLDEIKIARIEPAIGQNDSFEVIMDFEDEFDGDEGIAIVATFDGRAIGSTDSGTAAEDIPDGPSVFDLVIEVVKMVPVGALLGSADTQGGCSSMVGFANTTIQDASLSQQALLEVASVLKYDPMAVDILLNAAKKRKPKVRSRLTLLDKAKSKRS